MPDYSVGFFVVPMANLNALRKVEDEALQALATDQPDRSWRWNQMFQRAHDVAVKSAIVGGDYHPLDNDAWNNAYLRMGLWLRTRFFNNNQRHVLGPEMLDIVSREFESIRVEEFLQWNDEHGSKRYDEVEPALLIELFQALGRALQPKRSELYGFIYADFWEKYRDPPPPEPDEPEDTITVEDGAKRKEMVERRWNARISRQRREWWVDSPHHSRILLGMVAPERVAKLDSEYCAARAFISSNKILAGLAMMNDVVVPHTEAALLNPVIEVKEGPVRVHAWLQMELPWDTDQQPRAVCTPEQAIELDQILEERDEDELIESIWEMEVHWTRDLIRETYHRFRAALKGAIERGYGFAWLYDRNE